MIQHDPQKRHPVFDVTRGADLTVIIVNYNVREFLEQALSSVYRSIGDLEVEVIVVDNNSVDGSADLVRSSFPDVRLICNADNIGFGAANNLAILQSSGRHLLILNPDTIVQEDTLQVLVDFMDRNPDAGASGCRILNPDGSFARESRRSFPTPEVALFRMLGLSRLFPKSHFFGRYNLTYLPIDETAEVDALSGSCMMLRRDALVSSFDKSTGTTTNNRHGRHGRAQVPTRLFDEDFFMYGEDLDLCYRIQQSGWKVFYVPDTQIIHYKGESTRKGDLRYVRLFYGAMVLFSEKHFGQRSHLFRWALHAGIVVRAGASAASRAFKRLARPALDFLLVFASVVGVASVRFGGTRIELDPRFLLTIPLLYAVASVIGIRVSGGYRRGRQALGPVAAGLVVAFATVATLSFFFKTIAFSRLVIALSLAPALLLLSAWRLWANRERNGLRRALVVGDGLEAVRLARMITSLITPPFLIAGYLSDDETSVRTDLPATRLGSLRQIRDVIRVHEIDEVIFATEGLPNQTVLSLMRELRDLPVEFKTFVEGGSHVIGKANVEDLSVPLVPAEDTHGRPTGRFAQMALQRFVAAAGICAIPFVYIAARLSRSGSWERVKSRLAELPDVLAGRRALVGYRSEDAFHPPVDWELGPGVFSVSDSLPVIDATPEDLQRAWLFYLNNRTAGLDLKIVLSGFRTRSGRRS